MHKLFMAATMAAGLSLSAVPQTAEANHGCGYGGHYGHSSYYPSYGYSHSSYYPRSYGYSGYGHSNYGYQPYYSSYGYAPRYSSYGYSPYYSGYRGGYGGSGVSIRGRNFGIGIGW